VQSVIKHTALVQQPLGIKVKAPTDTQNKFKKLKKERKTTKTTILCA